MGIKENIKRFYSLSLEHRIFIVIGIIGTIFSFFTAILNLILGIGWIPVVASFVMGVFTIIIMYLSIIKDKYSTYALITLIILSFILFPSIWIVSGGSKGTIPLFYILNLFFIPLVLNRKTAKIMMFLNIIFILSLILLEYFNPSIIIPYENDVQRIIDVGFITILLCISAYVLATLIKSEYDNKIDSLHKAKEQMEVLSNTDALTSLYNRRYIKNMLLDNITNCNDFSVIMIDIDDFKSINDTYGHSVGDDVIIRIGKTIKNSLSENAIVGRIGGEEFFIIIKEKYSKKIYSIAEDIRIKIQKLKFNKIKRPVTISLGAYNPTNSDSVDDIFVQVDNYLYEAKNLGKNRVIQSI